MRKLFEAPQDVLTAVSNILQQDATNDDALLALLALSYMVNSWDRHFNVAMARRTFRDTAKETMRQMQALINSGSVPNVRSALMRMKENPVMIKDMLHITAKKLRAAYDEAGFNDYALPR